MSVKLLSTSHTHIYWESSFGRKKIRILNSKICPSGIISTSSLMLPTIQHFAIVFSPINFLSFLIIRIKYSFSFSHNDWCIFHETKRSPGAARNFQAKKSEFYINSEIYSKTEIMDTTSVIEFKKDLFGFSRPLLLRPLKGAYCNIFGQVI